MKFILGQKLKMTQVFAESGQVCPVTVIKIGPVLVTGLRTPEKDGYAATQICLNGKTKREFPVADLKVGDEIKVDIFAEGDKVTVSGLSKGKGFQGVVKRHGFHGGPRSHGQKHSEREPGSIGGGLRTRVPKGMRMAGRMGQERVTVANLRVVKVDPEASEIYLSGAVPGRRGTVVEIRGN